MTVPAASVRRAIVTGASRGIGRAIAKRLAADGMAVGLAARSRDALESLAAELRACGASAAVEVADLSQPDAAAAKIRGLADRMGGVDVLVHNAGAFVERPVPDLLTDEWRRVMDVNVAAPFAITRELLPLLERGGNGRIVFIGSTASHQGYLNQSAYVASKHALMGLARSLAIECKPRGIHVHTVSPGAVDTDLIKGTYLYERTRGQTMIAPDDVAVAVAYLIAQPARLDLPELVIRRT